MSNCLNCGKDVIQKEGKRERKYCDDNCKMAFHNKHKREPKYVLFKTFKDLSDKYEELKAGKIPEIPSELLQNSPIIPNTAKDKAKKKEVKETTENNKSIPPMPVRGEKEDSFDFAARKNEWKIKYNQ